MHLKSICCSLVSIDWWDKMAERLRAGVVYPEPWFDASIIMVTKTPEKTKGFDPWAWTLPFDAYVWATILALIFTTALDRKASCLQMFH
jgi:hypothetical protein